MKQKNNIVNIAIVSNIEFYTKLSIEQRKKIINWFNKQNVEFQILVFEEQRNQFFKLKNEGAPKDILSLASYLLSIKYFYDKEQLLKSKNKSQSLIELGKTGKIEKIKLKKEKPKQKHQLLLSMDSIIGALHNDGYSSRNIEKILLKKYKKEVSHSYINSYIQKYVAKKEN